MNHKQFKGWILDEPRLNDSQRSELTKHLAACPQCKQLDTGWQASKELIKQAAPKAPAPGFSMRWQAFAEKKCQMKKVRQYRISIFLIILAVFFVSLTYMVASGSFLHMLADIFSSTASLLFGITKGLSSIGSWLERTPIAVPLTLGFIFFGLINAFILASLFTLWNLKQRKLQTNEIKTTD
jgi:hypothetical protein